MNSSPSPDLRHSYVDASTQTPPAEETTTAASCNRDEGFILQLRNLLVDIFKINVSCVSIHACTKIIENSREI